jgi:hypothetical protein
MYCLFQHLVIRQRRSGRQAQHFDRAALGSAVFLPLFHHQSRGGGGDFFL